MAKVRQLGFFPRDVALPADVISTVGAPSCPIKQRPPGIWPVELSLADAMEVFWRVKSFEMTSSWGPSARTTCYVQPLLDVDEIQGVLETFAQPGRFEARSERDLILATQSIEHASDDYGADDSDIRNRGTWLSICLYYTATAFFPVINLSVGILGPPENAALAQWLMTDGGGFENTGNKTANATFKLSNFQTTFSFDELTAQSGPATESCEVEIKPVEYWSYDGTYDTVTGAQLKAFS
jgi:hypothetical protein